jgi:hypothetical protein
MNRIIFLCVTLIMIQSIKLFSDDLKTITDTNAVFYSSPSGKVIKYKFKEGELLPVILKTNINSTDWNFVKLPMKKQGWVQAKYSLSILDNTNVGKLYAEILKNELINPDDMATYYNNESYYIYNLKFLDYSMNGYIGLTYFKEADDGGHEKTVLYRIGSNGIDRVLDTGFKMDKTLFLEKYILIIDYNDGVAAFDKQKMIKDDPIFRPKGKLYKKSDTFSIIYLYAKKYGRNKSTYFEFDEKTLEITAHIKDKSGKFLIEKWRFDDMTGKFVKQ